MSDTWLDFDFQINTAADQAIRREEQRWRELRFLSRDEEEELYAELKRKQEEASDGTTD